MGADFGKSRGEGGHTANPFRGGGGGWGMDIFWNNTLTFLRNSQDKKERTKRNKHVRMQKGATFTIVSTSLLIGLNFKR